MRTATITATWTTRHTFEVDDDWECPSNLDGFTDEQLDEMTSHTAELIDWEEQ